MGASTFRTPETGEEVALRSAAAAITLAGVLRDLIDNPKLMKQLGEDAASSLAMTNEQVRHHEAAILDMQRVEESKKAVAEAHAALEEKQHATDVNQQQEIIKFQTYKKGQLELIKEATANHQKDVNDLAAREHAHEQKKHDLDGYSAQLDGRAAELDRRSKAADEKLTSDTLAAERQLANREAAIAKREKAALAKEAKLEELKAALKG